MHDFNSQFDSTLVFALSEININNLLPQEIMS